MIRLIVSVASRVCSVESTRWPVSAADSAVRTVSSSRISPIRITSGSWRRTRRIARREALGVLADLALVDDRELVAVQVLDRVLERDDVARAGRVDVVDHRRQRRGLARAGGAGEQDDPALLLGERRGSPAAARGRRSSAPGRGSRGRRSRRAPRWRKALTRKRETPGDLVGEVGLAVARRTPRAARRSSRMCSSAASVSSAVSGSAPSIGPSSP